MDEIIKKSGEFGRYQTVMLLIIGYASALCGFTQYMSVFNNAVPEFDCFQVNSTIILPQTCEIFNNITKSNKLDQNPIFECHYSKEFYGKTIVNQWDLICDKISLAGLTQSMYQVGAVSAFFVGYLSDMYGRKKVCLLISILLTLNMIICELFQLDAFGFNNLQLYVLYLITQFVSGFTIFSLDMVTFVLLFELTTAKYSNFISRFNMTFYAVGELVLLVVSFYFRDWRKHNLFAGIASLILFIIISLFISESPR